ncbi:MAG: bile acid:sodium symporter family protein [Hyphomonadaceae bacterium]|nr:bile acid:sodium symporter family protein [Hyphomonadaceae bacterium]
MAMKNPLAPALKLLRLDVFTFLILLVLSIALVVPARGQAAALLSPVTNVAIGVLFFLHGARLSRQAIMAGIAHWRFHLAALALTFVLFPALAILIHASAASLLPGALLTGLIYLCVLPSTVQSSIAYTAMAHGNVPAAICSASLSNLVGVFATPLLAAALIGAQGTTATLTSIQMIVSQILLPFIAGHLFRPLIGTFVDRHKAALSWFDRGVILAIVYRAFSSATVERVWTQLSPTDFIIVLGFAAALLIAAIFGAAILAQALKFDRADKVALTFCGVQKSLASGAPMASVIFPAATVGAVLLPLMIYHQVQLMVGAVMARRFAQQSQPT